MWGRIMDWCGDFQQKYGEGSPADLDWGKLTIIGLCVYIVSSIVTQDLFRHLRIHGMAKPTHPKDMRDLDARQQLLVILMEECGELIQRVLNVYAEENCFNTPIVNQNLSKSHGDVYTMLDLLHEWDVVSWNDIEERRDVKRQKLSRWSDLITPEGSIP